MKRLAVLALIAFSNSASVSQTVSQTVSIELGSVPERITPVRRIVNGQEASQKQYPHQALLIIGTLQGSFQCGGSLINSMWVVSAAHCIIGARSVQVQLGSVNRNSMPIVRPAIQIYRLNTYDPSTLRDDISLLKLASPVLFSSNVHPIKLPTNSQASDLYLSSVLIVSGFGLTTENKTSTILQYTTVVGIANEECKETYGSSIRPSVLCTLGYPNRNQGSCQGDSGGPLIMENENSDSILVGIVSFGSKAGCAVGVPQGFTRIGSYLKWIKSMTKMFIRED